MFCEPSERAGTVPFVFIERLLLRLQDPFGGVKLLANLSSYQAIVRRKADEEEKPYSEESSAQREVDEYSSRYGSDHRE